MPPVISGRRLVLGVLALFIVGAAPASADSVLVTGGRPARAQSTGLCTGPSSVLIAALTSSVCAGQSVPRSIPRRFTQTAKLIGQAASSSLKQKKRPLKKAKRLLKQSEANAARAAQGKKAKLSSDCAATIKGAADCVLADLGSCDLHCTGSCVADASDDLMALTTTLIGTAHAGRNTEIHENYTVDDNGNVQDAGTLMTTEDFVADGEFYASGLIYPQGISYSLPERRFTYAAHVDTVGSCTVLTARETDLTGTGPNGPPNDPYMTPLDIGPAGSVTNGQVTEPIGLVVTGTPQYPEHIYKAPDHTLLGQGFDAGQTVTMSYPGGADLGPLSGTNVVPPRIQLLSPMEALTDPNFLVDPNQPFTATWAASRW
jgi:hypothetical protein